jgi:hypothetical protein
LRIIDINEAHIPTVQNDAAPCRAALIFNLQRYRCDACSCRFAAASCGRGAQEVLLPSQ